MVRTDKGFIYIWALFSVAIFGIALAGVGQIWQTKAQREKERELLFVGEQFQKAIMSYYNDASTGLKQYPESLQDLLLDSRSSTPKRHLRKIFLDPMTNSYEWGLVKESDSEQIDKEPGSEQAEKESESEQADKSIFISKDPKIIGVYSRSKKVPIKIKNFSEDFSDFSKADSYQDWKFIFLVQDNSSQPETTESEAAEPDKLITK